MSHKFLIPILTAAFLVAPAMLPRALVSAIAPGVSGAAQAESAIKNNKSNSFRTTKTDGSVTTPKAGGDVDRMGGGGGTNMGGGNVNRMGGGGGANMGGSNVNRMGGGGGGTNPK
jgi:hypothetical protein